jgi:hypothetical protein
LNARVRRRTLLPLTTRLARRCARGRRSRRRRTQLPTGLRAGGPSDATIKLLSSAELKDKIDEQMRKLERDADCDREDGGFCRVAAAAAVAGAVGGSVQG